jgi:hypothetical protein
MRAAVKRERSSFTMRLIRYETVCCGSDRVLLISAAEMQRHQFAVARGQLHDLRAQGVDHLVGCAIVAPLDVRYLDHHGDLLARALALAQGLEALARHDLEDPGADVGLAAVIGIGAEGLRRGPHAHHRFLDQVLGHARVADDVIGEAVRSALVAREQS